MPDGRKLYPPDPIADNIDPEYGELGVTTWNPRLVSTECERCGSGAPPCPECFACLECGDHRDDCPVLAD